LNKVFLMSRLVADPELRFTQYNDSICRFRVAVNKSDGNADFFNIVAWKGTAEFVSKYFKKGNKILIEGHLKTNSWDDNGTKRYETYTVADHIFFCDSKNANSNPTELNEDDEDLPF